MAYVDGFMIAVPKDKLDAYKDMARKCEPIWREYRRHRLCRMRRRRHALWRSHLFPPRRAGQGGRDRDLFLDRLSVQGGARRLQQEGDGRSAPEGHDDKDMPFDGKRMIYGGLCSPSWAALRTDASLRAGYAACPGLRASPVRHGRAARSGRARPAAWDRQRLRDGG